MLKTTLGMSERLACKAVGLSRSTYRRLPLAQTSADPDNQLRAWLRSYATKHPCHGFPRAWAALRYDERREVNKKKVHRFWREEGLQVKATSSRKRAGVSSVPQIPADAPRSTMTHSECPQQCTAFGGSARRKRAGSTIGSYCRISSARLRVLCSPMVRKTLLEVA